MMCFCAIKKMPHQFPIRHELGHVEVQQDEDTQIVMYEFGQENVICLGNRYQLLYENFLIRIRQIVETQ